MVPHPIKNRSKGNETNNKHNEITNENSITMENEHTALTGTTTTTTKEKHGSTPLVVLCTLTLTLLLGLAYYPGTHHHYGVGGSGGGTTRGGAITAAALFGKKNVEYPCIHPDTGCICDSCYQHFDHKLGVNVCTPADQYHFCH